MWKTSLGNHGREVTVTSIKLHGNVLALILRLKPRIEEPQLCLE